MSDDPFGMHMEKTFNIVLVHPELLLYHTSRNNISFTASWLAYMQECEEVWYHSTLTFDTDFAF